MTVENWIALFGFGVTWVGLLIKIIVDSRKKPLCPLDRSQSIFKINLMENKMDKIDDQLGKLRAQANEGIRVAHKNGEYGERTIEIQQATAIYLQQLIEQQKKTNELLDAIRRNGNGVTK